MAALSGWASIIKLGTVCFWLLWATNDVAIGISFVIRIQSVHVYSSKVHEYKKSNYFNRCYQSMIGMRGHASALRIFPQSSQFEVGTDETHPENDHHSHASRGEVGGHHVR